MFMGKLIGYMVTWTAYGSWLQGDKRRYVKKGEILPAQKNLAKSNRNQQKHPAVILTKEEKDIVKEAIAREAERIGHRITTLAVCSNHVHLAAEAGCKSIEKSVSRYKNVAMFALWKKGKSGKIWTRGFDKRFCFNKQDFENKIKYIEQHNK